MTIRYQNNYYNRIALFDKMRRLAAIDISDRCRSVDSVKTYSDDFWTDVILYRRVGYAPLSVEKNIVFAGTKTAVKTV